MDVARPRDPLRTYQFSIWFMAGQGRVPVGGVQKVSGLTSTVTATETWEGGNNLHRYANPDRVTWDPVTLEQGLALGEGLEKWAASVRSFAMSGRPDPGEPVKRDVMIEIADPVRIKPAEHRPRRVRRYVLKNAWISKYVALPRLDALVSEVAFLTVELIHEGFTVEAVLEPFIEDSQPGAL